METSAIFQKYAEHYEILNRKKNYKEEIDFVWKWAGRPYRILDLGCGTAHYWQYFPGKTLIRGFERSMEMKNLSPFKENIMTGDVCQVDYSVYESFDCVTALFHVMNYLPDISFMDKLPIKDRGFFIFDLLRPGKFSITEREIDGVKRTITPLKQSGKKVSLEVKIEAGGETYKEVHDLTIWTQKDIEKSTLKIVDVRDSWFKLQKK